MDGAVISDFGMYSMLSTSLALWLLLVIRFYLIRSSLEHTILQRMYRIHNLRLKSSSRHSFWHTGQGRLMAERSNQHKLCANDDEATCANWHMKYYLLKVGEFSRLTAHAVCCGPTCCSCVLQNVCPINSQQLDHTSIQSIATDIKPIPELSLSFFLAD